MTLEAYINSLIEQGLSDSEIAIKVQEFKNKQNSEQTTDEENFQQDGVAGAGAPSIDPLTAPSQDTEFSSEDTSLDTSQTFDPLNLNAAQEMLDTDLEGKKVQSSKPITQAVNDVYEEKIEKPKPKYGLSYKGKSIDFSSKIEVGKSGQASKIVDDYRDLLEDEGFEINNTSDTIFFKAPNGQTTTFNTTTGFNRFNAINDWIEQNSEQESVDTFKGNEKYRKQLRSRINSLIKNGPQEYRTGLEDPETYDETYQQIKEAAISSFNDFNVGIGEEATFLGFGGTTPAEAAGLSEYQVDKLMKDSIERFQYSEEEKLDAVETESFANFIEQQGFIDAGKFFDYATEKSIKKAPSRIKKMAELNRDVTKIKQLLQQTPYGPERKALEQQLNYLGTKLDPLVESYTGKEASYFLDIDTKYVSNEKSGEEDDTNVDLTSKVLPVLQQLLQKKATDFGALQAQFGLYTQETDELTKLLNRRVDVYDTSTGSDAILAKGWKNRLRQDKNAPNANTFKNITIRELVDSYITGKGFLRKDFGDGLKAYPAGYTPSDKDEAIEIYDNKNISNIVDRYLNNKAEKAAFEVAYLANIDPKDIERTGGFTTFGRTVAESFTSKEQIKDAFDITSSETLDAIEKIGNQAGIEFNKAQKENFKQTTAEFVGSAVGEAPKLALEFGLANLITGGIMSATGLGRGLMTLRAGKYYDEAGKLMTSAQVSKRAQQAGYRLASGKAAPVTSKTVQDFVKATPGITKTSVTPYRTLDKAIELGASSVIEGIKMESIFGDGGFETGVAFIPASRLTNVLFKNVIGGNFIKGSPYHRLNELVMKPAKSGLSLVPASEMASISEAVVDDFIGGKDFNTYWDENFADIEFLNEGGLGRRLVGHFITGSALGYAHVNWKNVKQNYNDFLNVRAKSREEYFKLTDEIKASGKKPDAEQKKKLDALASTYLMAENYIEAANNGNAEVTPEISAKQAQRDYDNLVKDHKKNTGQDLNLSLNIVYNGEGLNGRNADVKSTQGKDGKQYEITLDARKYRKGIINHEVGHVFTELYGLNSKESLKKIRLFVEDLVRKNTGRDIFRDIEQAYEGRQNEETFEEEYLMALVEALGQGGSGLIRNNAYGRLKNKINELFGAKSDLKLQVDTPEQLLNIINKLASGTNVSKTYQALSNLVIKGPNGYEKVFDVTSQSLVGHVRGKDNYDRLTYLEAEQIELESKRPLTQEQQDRFDQNRLEINEIIKPGTRQRASLDIEKKIEELEDKFYDGLIDEIEYEQQLSNLKSKKGKVTTKPAKPTELKTTEEATQDQLDAEAKLKELEDQYYDGLIDDIEFNKKSKPLQSTIKSAKGSKTTAETKAELDSIGKKDDYSYDTYAKEINSVVNGWIESKARAFRREDGAVVNLESQKFGLPGFSMEAMVAETNKFLIPHMRRFDPAKNDSFYGWVSSQLGNKMKDALKTGNVANERFDIDATELKGLAGTEFTDAGFEQAETAEAARERRAIDPIRDLDVKTAKQVKDATQIDPEIVETITPKYIEDNFVGKVGEIMTGIPAAKVVGTNKNFTYGKFNKETGKYEDVIVNPETGKELKQGETGGILKISDRTRAINYFKKGENARRHLQTLPEFNVARSEAEINEQGETILVAKDVRGRSVVSSKLVKDYFYEPYIDPKSGDPTTRERAITSPKGRSKSTTSQTPVVRLKPKFRGRISEETINEFKRELEEGSFEFSKGNIKIAAQNVANKAIRGHIESFKQPFDPLLDRIIANVKSATSPRLASLDTAKKIEFEKVPGRGEYRSLFTINDIEYEANLFDFKVIEEMFDNTQPWINSLQRVTGVKNVKTSKYKYLTFEDVERGAEVLSREDGVFTGKRYVFPEADTKQSLQVFGTLANHIIGEANKGNIDGIVFTGKDASRRRLYEAMTDRFADQLGWNYDIIQRKDAAGGNTYVIGRPESAEAKSKASIDLNKRDAFLREQGYDNMRQLMKAGQEEVRVETHVIKSFNNADFVKRINEQHGIEVLPENMLQMPFRSGSESGKQVFDAQRLRAFRRQQTQFAEFLPETIAKNRTLSRLIIGQHYRIDGTNYKYFGEKDASKEVRDENGNILSKSEIRKQTEEVDTFVLNSLFDAKLDTNVYSKNTKDLQQRLIDIIGDGKIEAASQQRIGTIKKNLKEAKSRKDQLKLIRKEAQDTKANEAREVAFNLVNSLKSDYVNSFEVGSKERADALAYMVQLARSSSQIHYGEKALVRIVGGASGRGEYYLEHLDTAQSTVGVKALNNILLGENNYIEHRAILVPKSFAKILDSEMAKTTDVGILRLLTPGVRSKINKGDVFINNKEGKFVRFDEFVNDTKNWTIDELVAHDKVVDKLIAVERLSKASIDIARDIDILDVYDMKDVVSRVLFKGTDKFKNKESFELNYKNLNAEEQAAVRQEMLDNNVLVFPKDSRRAAIDLSKRFNKMIERSTSGKMPAGRVVSDSEAFLEGAGKGKYDIFIRPAAEDFVGLLYKTLGKGKVGDNDLKFYKTHLIDPYVTAVNNITKDRVNLMRDYKALVSFLKPPSEKGIKSFLKKPILKNKVEGTEYTSEHAVRAYVWTKQGMDIPGLGKEALKKLLNHVKENEKLITFGNQLIAINKGDGYVKPGQSWYTGNIGTDLLEGLNTNKREKYLQHWQENVDVIFSKDNLNKLEAAYGKGYRKAMENMLQRMKTGRNRLFNPNPVGRTVHDMVNGAVGAVMFLNDKSAVLQTISSLNFINFGDNNIFAAGKALANQKQYWKDFSELFNSDFLKDRRSGLRLNVNEAEIADIARNKGFRGVTNRLLQLGFTPTQIADSFAIAAGGSTFYRNRIKTYEKEVDANGNKLYTPEQAKELAFRDFRREAEQSQQSSDPMMISQEQADSIGRYILAFANTPSQYARIIKKAASDLKNGRGDAKTNISKIIYYSFAQNVIFTGLQQAIFATAFDDDGEITEDKTINAANGMANSLLRGMGIYPAIFAAVKDAAIKLYTENKENRPEYEKAAVQLLNISPPIGSKYRKIAGGLKSFDYTTKEEFFEKGISIDNPGLRAGARVIEGGTNLPLDRLLIKLENINGALDQDNEYWQRIALALGWQDWQLGIKDKKETGVRKTRKREVKRREVRRR